MLNTVSFSTRTDLKVGYRLLNENDSCKFSYHYCFYVYEDINVGSSEQISFMVYMVQSRSSSPK